MLGQSEKFDLLLNRNNNNNNFTSSSKNPISSFAWASNMNNLSDHTPNTFDELFNATTTNSLRNNEPLILNSNISNNRFTNQTKNVGEIGTGLKNGNYVTENLSELPVTKHDYWLYANDSSNANSQLASFFNENVHTQDMISPKNANVTSTSSNGPGNSFESDVWSNTLASSISSSLWPEFSTFSNFGNNSCSLESNNFLNLGTNEFDMKKFQQKLIKSDNSISSVDYQSRAQLFEVMKVFKKVLFDLTLSQDIHLCSSNFENFLNLIKSDLSKFEASTFTEDDIQLFREIYSTHLKSLDNFKEEKQNLEDNFEQFSLLVNSILQTKGSNKEFMLDDNQIRRIFEKLSSSFNVLYSAKYNNIFLSLVKFYKDMVYSIPTELLNNLQIIKQHSKNLSENNVNFSDPLFLAYKNFINELKIYNKQNSRTMHSQKTEEVNSVNQVLNKIKNNVGELFNENKDVNNNKKLDNSKDCNKICNDKEFLQKQSKYNIKNAYLTKARSIFSQVSQIKSEAFIYMPFYYPVDHNMLYISGPITIFCNKIKIKSSYYITPNRQAFEYVVENELSKTLPGPVLLEKTNSLIANKSFSKIVNKLKKHFPNLTTKQLVELTIQSKYAIMKKYKHQYGFSGFKLKDMVNYVIEYICENANIPNSDSIKGVSSVTAALAAKGVSWSKVASASNQASGPLLMFPSTSMTKDSASTSTSNSPSPSLISNTNARQHCALCRFVVPNNSTDDKRKMAVIACGHVFHKNCIDFLTSVKSVCPICEQFILRNEEFPSL